LSHGSVQGSSPVFSPTHNGLPNSLKDTFSKQRGSSNFYFGDDFIGFRQHNPNIFIYDENLDENCREMNYKVVQISKTTDLYVMGKTIQLIDIEARKVTKEMKLKIEVKDWHFNCNLLVCVHKIADREHLLSVWRVENSLNLNHIKDVAIEDYNGSLEGDEMFIAIKTYSEENTGRKTYKFISTFQIERLVSFRVRYLAYDTGYLFLQNKNLVRILDVASGTFLRNIRLEPDQLDSIVCCANSNYVVILSCNKFYSKLSVYDLKCLKQTDAVPSHLLLISIDLNWIVEKIAMNETRIVCLNSNTMYAVDLQPINRLRCPEYNE
jgi:hypothetical protein